MRESSGRVGEEWRVDGHADSCSDSPLAPHHSPRTIGTEVAARTGTVGDTGTFRPRSRWPASRKERRAMSSTVEKSIDVQVPIRAVYNQWTQFEEFPRFMEGVQEVKQLDDKRLHWTRRGRRQGEGVGGRHRRADPRDPDRLAECDRCRELRDRQLRPHRRRDARDGANHLRHRGARREGRRRAGLRVAPGRGRPATLQGIHRVAQDRRPAPGAARSTPARSSPAAGGATSTGTSSV